MFTALYLVAVVFISISIFVLGCLLAAWKVYGSSFRSQILGGVTLNRRGTFYYTHLPFRFWKTPISSFWIGNTIEQSKIAAQFVLKQYRKELPQIPEHLEREACFASFNGRNVWPIKELAEYVGDTNGWYPGCANRGYDLRSTQMQGAEL